MTCRDGRASLGLRDETSGDVPVTKRLQQLIYRAAGGEPVVKVGCQFLDHVDLLFAAQPALLCYCLNTIPYAPWESGSGKEALEVAGLGCHRLNPLSDP